MSENIKHKKYALLPMEDEEMGPTKVVKKKEKRRQKHTSIRRKDDNTDRWDDESVHSEEEDFQESASKRVKTTHTEDELSEAEQERRRDQEEKDAFTKRLRMKDADKTKNITEASTKEQRSLLPNNNPAAVSDLRERSRQDYLQKREAERLALLRQQVQQETEELRSGVRLSARETAEFEKNRQVLALAEERNKIDDQQLNNGYALPEDYFARSKTDVLNKRHVERDQYGHEKFVSEHDEWDRHQEGLAKAQVKSRERVDDNEYDYLLDEKEGIQFLLDSNLAGGGRILDKEARFQEQQLRSAETKALSISEAKKNLPVYKYRTEFLEALKTHQVLIVNGETGSGKTTQLPQYLHEAGYTKGGMKIGVTQPRRVAAMSVAQRVAEEVGVKIGNEVGYAIRFEDCTNDKTVIKYMTDGHLLKEIVDAPDLNEYSCIMIDEAHERTIDSDVLLALLKDLALAREDLRIIISSATLSADKFSDYFAGAPVFFFPGRPYPVEEYFTPSPESNYLAAAVTTLFQIHTSQSCESGDILIFLTGQEEIEAAANQITEISRKLGTRVPELIICEIYANLPTELQTKIFEPTPPGSRKVILATNIAETSLTIDGIMYVIDPGFVKENIYNPATGMSNLVTVPVSRASANQRKGRAGRTGPGKCFRLYTKWAYMNEMDENSTPQIQQSNLDSIVLMLKAMGINDLLNFDFMDAPPTETLIAALNKLYSLAALNDKGELTVLGRKLSELPIDPCLGKSLLAADKFGCVDEVLSIVAMLSEGSALFAPRPKDTTKRIQYDSAHRRFEVQNGGDHLMMLTIWNSWYESGFSNIFAKENFLQQRTLVRVRDVRDQLAKLCERVEVTISSCGAADLVPIQKAITSGFFTNAARLQRGGDSYRVMKGHTSVYIHPSSVLMDPSGGPGPKFVLYYELMQTSKEYMRGCMPIQIEWLSELAPHYYKKNELDAPK